MVTAPARGIFCKVMKNKVSAVTPNIPLAKRTFLLFPNTGIFFFFKLIKLISRETIERKKTNSNTGICGNAFTHKCISENANEEIRDKN